MQCMKQAEEARGESLIDPKSDLNSGLLKNKVGSAADLGTGVVCGNCFLHRSRHKSPPILRGAISLLRGFELKQDLIQRNTVHLLRFNRGGTKNRW